MSDPSAWQVVLVDQGEGRRQVVLHNRRLNEFAVRRGVEEAEDTEEEEDLEVISQQQQGDSSTSSSAREGSSPPPLAVCPLCRRPTTQRPAARDSRSRRLPASKDSNYFNLLSEANSLANTPRTTGQPHQQPDEQEPPLDKGALNSGYFDAFFEEIQLLGRGGAGSVHLVRHVLNGEQLGLYACKKGEYDQGSLLQAIADARQSTVAVGDSSHSL